MNAEWLPALLDSIKRLRSNAVGDVLGCSEQDVQGLEEHFGTALPSAYRQFLLSAGGAQGDFFEGSDFSFEALGRVRVSAQLLLEEDGMPPLTADQFPFCSHQGYQFLVLALDRNPDPPVDHYLEGSGGLRRVAPSFTAWLRMALDDEYGPET